MNEVMVMSMVCPIGGCKSQKGMCMHEKAMGVILAAVVLYFVFKAVR